MSWSIRISDLFANAITEKKTCKDWKICLWRDKVHQRQSSKHPIEKEAKLSDLSANYGKNYDRRTSKNNLSSTLAYVIIWDSQMSEWVSRGKVHLNLKETITVNWKGLMEKNIFI